MLKCKDYVVQASFPLQVVQAGYCNPHTSVESNRQLSYHGTARETESQLHRSLQLPHHRRLPAHLRENSAV